MKTEAAERRDEAVLPHQRQFRRIGDDATQHVYGSVKDYYRKEYFVATDAP